MIHKYLTQYFSILRGKRQFMKEKCLHLLHRLLVRQPQIVSPFQGAGISVVLPEGQAVRLRGARAIPEQG